MVGHRHGPEIDNRNCLNDTNLVNRYVLGIADGKQSRKINRKVMTVQKFLLQSLFQGVCWRELRAICRQYAASMMLQT